MDLLQDHVDCGSPVALRHRPADFSCAMLAVRHSILISYSGIQRSFLQLRSALPIPAPNLGDTFFNLRVFIKE